MIENARPIRARRSAPAARALSLLTAAAVAAAGFAGAAVVPTRAQAAPKMPIIRDTEIENLLRDYARPILRVAGLAKQNIKVVIINNSSFNAFVMDGRHIFVNAGALFQSKTPNEIIGVLAHETGHLAGGHLIRMREKLAQAQTQSIVAMLLGVGALAAGAASGSASVGQIGPAAISAPQSAIFHSVLAYARTQEDQADHAALKFLRETHQSPKGMVDLFKRLENETLFSARGADPYLRTHPMPAQRVAALEQKARASPYWNKKDPPALQLRHDLMRAKLSGFLESRATVLRRYPLSNHSLPARYARAISTYRHGSLRSAIAQIDGLIASEPNNPYFYELKGQALLEGGRGSASIAPLRRAVALSHHAPLIDIMLAQALIGTNKRALASEAVHLLNTALRREPHSASAYTQLAMAYGHTGDIPRADLASAQAAFARGDVKTARMLAERAKRGLKVGSPPWVRADDIVSVKLPRHNRR
ncbi:MAG: M48 family metalloprotease [Pseudolabrys sp.]